MYNNEYFTDVHYCDHVSLDNINMVVVHYHGREIRQIIIVRRVIRLIFVRLFQLQSQRSRKRSRRKNKGALLVRNGRWRYGDSSYANEDLTMMISGYGNV